MERKEAHVVNKQNSPNLIPLFLHNYQVSIFDVQQLL